MKRCFFALLLFPIITHAQGIITTVAGNGIATYSGDGSQATLASINQPTGIVTDHAGNLYISDYYNNVVRKVSSLGVITTIAGNGTLGLSGDGGPATNAQLSGPLNLALDAFGNIYVGSYNSNRVRKITPSGIISTFAGITKGGYSGDGGQATAAQLNTPTGLAVDHSGNVYIADFNNYRIRKVDTLGIITTIAGNGIPGNSGDGGLAITAQLNGAYGICLDNASNLYVGDAFNNKVRKITVSGIITTFSGNGIPGFTGDGATATTAELNNPPGIAADAFGNIYIADQFNNRIRKVSPTGIITTVAGNGIAGFSGDGGPATASEINQSNVITVNAAGQLLICDNANNRIRLVTNTCISDITTQPVPDTVLSGDNATFTVTPGAVIPSCQWQEDPGTGFVNLANVWPYSGVYTNSLTIHNASMYLNATHYRCILNYEASCPPDTTNAVILIIHSNTGLSQSAIESINIFPNPVHNNIFIELPNLITEATIQIINHLGQVNAEKKIYNNNNAFLNLDLLPLGMYFLKIKFNDQIIYRKIIKK